MKRLIVFVMGLLSVAGVKGQGVVDVHSHLVTPEYLSVLGQEGRLMEEGIPVPGYDVEAHLKWMDETGIVTSVLTLAEPTPHSRHRMFNEAAARLKAAHPGRFLFCAALPLPDVDAAIREAVYALDTLKADGIKLSTNADGQYLGAPELDALFEVLNERRAVVILHPHRPQPVNEQVMVQTPLAMQEYLSETTRAVTNMISRNVPARYPDVKVVVPHCGAYLPLAVPRMKSLTPVMQKNKMVGDIDWEKNLAALYYDLAGAHSPEVIRMMLTITTPDHLLYGSDYPYVAPQVLTASMQRMKRYLTDEADLAPYKEMILHGNAQKLFEKSLPWSALNPKPTPSLPLTPPQGRGTPAGVGLPPLGRVGVGFEASSLICRIAEIEVFPQYLSEYLSFANEVGRLSVEREPGVICLFPMQLSDDPTQIRILEIYASGEAYRQHIKTDHFLKYKKGTLHMVKSLNLPSMQTLDVQTMGKIFRK